jgi:hypothetical protein
MWTIYGVGTSESYCYIGTKYLGTYFDIYINYKNYIKIKWSIN